MERHAQHEASALGDWGGAVLDWLQSQVLKPSGQTHQTAPDSALGCGYP